MHSPRAKCPVSGQDVPPTAKYQHRLSSDGKLGTGPENKAGSIQLGFVENSYAYMQPCCASMDIKLESIQLACTPQLPELVLCQKEFTIPLPPKTFCTSAVMHTS